MTQSVKIGRRARLITILLQAMQSPRRAQRPGLLRQLPRAGSRCLRWPQTAAPKNPAPSIGHLPQRGNHDKTRMQPASDRGVRPTWGRIRRFFKPGAVLPARDRRRPTVGTRRTWVHGYNGSTLEPSISTTSEGDLMRLTQIGLSGVAAAFVLSVGAGCGTGEPMMMEAKLNQKLVGTWKSSSCAPSTRR